jgi:hypothetical protein
LGKCFKIKKKVRDYIYLIQTTFTSEIGWKITCKDMEPIYSFQEKFIKDSLKREINRATENVFILMVESMKGHGLKTIKSD